MNQAVYCVYDRVAKIFYTPFFQMNDDHAMRTFMSMARDQNTPMANAPGDFDLYHIGYYDQESGELTGGIYELVTRGAPDNGPEMTIVKESANA